jgi:hypothetical protein
MKVVIGIDSTDRDPVATLNVSVLDDDENPIHGVYVMVNDYGHGDEPDENGDLYETTELKT